MCTVVLSAQDGESSGTPSCAQDGVPMLCGSQMHPNFQADGSAYTIPQLAAF